jgi:hypothetical protein
MTADGYSLPGSTSRRSGHYLFSLWNDNVVNLRVLLLHTQ